MPVCEAGYEGFRLARRLEGEDLEVVVCDPASLEVVRRKRRAKTDRIDARKTVRAPVARDGGDRDAMSPVRVPTVAEEDAKRLLRRPGAPAPRRRGRGRPTARARRQPRRQRTELRRDRPRQRSGRPVRAEARRLQPVPPDVAAAHLAALQASAG